MNLVCKAAAGCFYSKLWGNFMADYSFSISCTIKKARRASAYPKLLVTIILLHWIFNDYFSKDIVLQFNHLSKMKLVLWSGSYLTVCWTPFPDFLACGVGY